ncbi:Bug family tripartite tricarboxylate transporter substrate binding protein [Cupriavidus necator]|uniref:Bug family tripartite tricarboxylate transporter substrate binding protein n=1 Tax=Cupriavidus necator TaxID=106590 RepID=UPI0006906FD0|nr:tripartite tricarboxylate transporter substrate binding protein [Cupriavidus necator]
MTNIDRARRALAWLATGVAITLIPAGGSALAQGYPERPVKIVSPTSPGTGVDDFSRLLAKHLTEKLGKPFYVENRPGGNSIIATDAVAKAAPNGYTLLLALSSAMSANPFLFKQLPYSPTRDFVPVARLSSLPVTVVVPATSPYRTLGQLMAAARAQPGKLNYGTSSSGYRAMLAAINDAGKAKAVDVPYKAMSTLLPDLIGGVVDYTVLEISAAVPLIQSGKLRALAVSNTARVPVIADVPTLAEAGMPDATVIGWVGLAAPAGTPAAVVDKLAEAALEFVNTPEAKAHFAQRGTSAYPLGPKAFASALVSDQAQWQRVISMAGILAE